MSALAEIPLKTIKGADATLGDYAGKVLLVVNVASKCGLTPQYEGLEKLYSDYKDEGLVVLGFPANEFAGQEPGTNEEIAAFCSATYGVTFPVFGKIKVNGLGTHPIYKALRTKRDANGRAGLVGWNFEKFIVAPGGDVVGRFRSKTLPDAPEVVAAIEAVLPG